MNKKFPALILTGALACALAVPALAADVPVPISAPVSAQETAALPASVLYYGTVQEIGKNEAGEMTWLRMTSATCSANSRHRSSLSASTITRTSGSVPDSRTRIRPEFPRASATAWTAA